MAERIRPVSITRSTPQQSLHYLHASAQIYLSLAEQEAEGAKGHTKHTDPCNACQSLLAFRTCRAHGPHLHTSICLFCHIIGLFCHMIGFFRATLTHKYMSLLRNKKRRALSAYVSFAYTYTSPLRNRKQRTLTAGSRSRWACTTISVAPAALTLSWCVSACACACVLSTCVRACVHSGCV